MFPTTRPYDSKKQFVVLNLPFNIVYNSLSSVTFFKDICIKENYCDKECVRQKNLTSLQVFTFLSAG